MFLLQVCEIPSLTVRVQINYILQAKQNPDRQGGDVVWSVPGT